MKSKKGQYYPAFLALFTAAALIFAYAAISSSKGVVDANGNNAYIGAKQAQVFHTLQDAEEIKTFIDNAAMLSAQEAFDEMRASCAIPQGSQSSGQEASGECGTYIYPLWSTSDKLCAPECQISLKGKFETKLQGELKKYEQATGASIPQEFEYEYEELEDDFILHGKMQQPVTLYSYPAREREIGLKTQEEIIKAKEISTIQLESDPDHVIDYEGFYSRAEMREHEAIFRSTYSFTPSFSIQVNKKIESPKSVSEFAEKTWNECTTDYHECITNQINEYNAKEESYKISFARQCEADPEKRQFLDFMEQIEDCMAGPYNGFACRINLTTMTGSRSIEIVMDASKVQTYSINSQNNFETVEKIEDAYYELQNGQFTQDSLPLKSIRFNFATNRKLESIEISGATNTEQLLSKNNNAQSSKTIILDASEKRKDIILVITDKNEGKANSILVDSYEGVYFTPPKESFRLCAQVRNKPATPSLFDLKFSLQMRKTGGGVCSDARIESFGQNKGPDSMVGTIATFKGFDITDVFSIIPIPGLNLLGITIAAADIAASIPDREDSVVKVTVDNVPDNVIGYKIYCSDSSIPFGQDITRGLAPQSFAYIEQKARQLEAAAKKANPYAATNPYFEASQLDKCGVPIADAQGKLRKVASKAVSKVDGSITMSVNTCGADGMHLDKLLKTEYCVTLVPVDADGNELPSCKITTCSKFNSLFDLALKRLLETQLSEITVVPASVIPSSIEPYIKTITAEDLADAAQGKRSFDFTDVIDTEQIYGDLSDKLKLGALEEINREILGDSLQISLETISKASKNAVLSEIASEIPNDEAGRILEEILNGQFTSEDARDAALSMGSEHIDDERAKETIKKIIQSEDLSSAAMQELTRIATDEFNEATLEQKKKVLEKASETEEGKYIRDKAIEAAKDCQISNPDVKEALDCLPEDKIEAIFREASLEGAGKVLSEVQLTDAESQAAREALSEIAKTGTLSIEAKDLLAEEIGRLTDDERASIISGALTGQTTIDEALQNEIVRVMPGTAYFDQVMNNPDIKALLGGSLEAELQRQLGLFTTEICEDE